MNVAALVITFLACALFSMTEGLFIQQPRCKCTKTIPMKFPDHLIVKMEKFQPGPHCKNTEIIATVKLIKLFTRCLNPDDVQVQNALKRNLV
ncbi:interleukin-8-like isoform X2 [Tachysurus vachellii]|uniref:interleukin-8-like isoform X2 n=1 Tax=Tachysurus vachellii TaxID=175792 RepID=UPI00296AAB10|nr:interleukin-8-like isoform X2 [Tachysurus vachellii]